MKKTLLTLALIAATVASSLAQGSFNPLNGTTSRLKVDDGSGVLRDALVSDGIQVQVFVGAANGEASTLVGTLGVNTTAQDATATTRGLMVGMPALFNVDGAAAQSQISVRYAAIGLWQNVNNRESKTITLGAQAGPATVIWGSTATATRFNSLIVTAVPEPSTIALGVLGLGSLLLFRRRK